MRVSSLVNDRTNGIRGRKKLAHIATLVVALVFQTISFEPAHAALTSWKLTATAATYVQGGTAPTLTATSNTSGSFQPLTLACGIFAAADTGFATPLSFSAALTAGTAAYKIHCTATAASGYATTPTTNTSGTLTVKIPWTSLTATAASYTQGGTAPTLTATSDPTGAKGTLTCRVYAATDTGYVNAVTPSASMSLTANFYKIHCTAPAATNYVSTPTTNTDADLTVNPPTTWTLTATAASYVQGGTAPALTGTASPGAAITGSSTCRVYAVADTGYVTPVTLSASLTVGNTDYVIHCTATAASGYASAPGTNTDAALTVTVSTVWTSLVATAATYVPGGTPPTLTGVATPSAAMTGAPTCQVYLATDTGFATPKTWAAVTVTGSTTYKIRCTGTAATGYNSTPTTNTTAWLTVPIAWAITPAIANYSQGGVVPIFKGAASPAAGLSGSLTCNAYAAADTGFATPLTLTASTATGNTYIVRCTGTAASGYAATPTINTAVLTVVANLSLTCNANFYQVGAGLLYKLTYTAAASPPFAYAAFGSSSTSSLNSIGWNPDDNYVYGAVSGNLYRIASNQTITNLGPTINAAGTATSPQNTGGDFYRINGTAYLMGGSGTTFTLTNVASRVVTSMTVSSGSWSPYDMTIIGNTAWGYDGTTLYKGVITSDGTLAGTTIAITSKAGVTGTVRGTTTSSDRYGAMYSDSDGNLYMFSNTGADLFEITAAAAAAAFASPATTPVATFIVHALTAAGTAISSPNDGASCPNASSPTAPTLTTTAGASSITLSGGHIAGTITTGTLTGSNIASGSLQFCYALTELLLASSPSCVNSSPDTMATGQTSAAISADLTGLTHGTLYYFRAKATNTQGTTGYGGNQSFTTLADWTLTADSKGYTIGGTVPTLTAVASPLAGLSGSATCRAYAPTDSLYATPLTVNASLAAGDYIIHCTGAGTSAYSSTPTTNVNATLRVTALLSWTITASPATYVLHSTIPTLSGGASPFAGLNGALTCQAFTTLDTGFTTPKTVDLTLAPGSYVVHCSGATTSGYAAPSVIDKVLTVTLGPWSLTAANKDYTIGGSAPSLTATASPAEALSGSATCNIYLPTDLGFVTALTINNGLSASVHYVIHCTGTAASGYAAAPTYVNAILNVTALLSWAITAADAHYTYGQTPASLSGAALPLAGLNGSLTCSAYAQSDLLFATALVLSTSTAAGTYVIHCTGTATNGYTSTPTINDAVLTVIAIGWTIAADAVAYAIGNSVPSLTGAASPAGALNGSLTCRAYPTTDLTYIGAVVVDANLPTGTYTIHCTGSPTAGYTPTPTITDHSLTVTVATHTVTYNGNTNTGGSVPVDSSSPYTYNTSATVKTNSGSLVKTGYTFNGWNTAADGSGTSRAATGSVTFTVASSDVVLYAQWAIASFTITFDLNGGNISGSTTNTTATVVYQVDAVASKPTNPTKTGYSFTGWNETGSGTALSSYAMPGVDSTLMAIWTAQPFTATYDLHGGTISGSTANPTAIVAFSADAIASKPTNPTMPGYSFSGWNLTGSGSVLTSYSMPAANTTLYAVWSAVPHVITYLVGNHWASGAVPTQIDVATAGTFTLAVSGLTGASGYRFAGWSDGTRTYHPGDTYTVALAAVNLTAMWQASSLDGIDLAKITLLGTIYANDTNASTITVTNAGTSITVNLPAGSLPAATKLDIYVQSDLTKARNLISDSASYLVSILIAWLTTDNAIPPTAVGKPITVTITNTALNTGDPVFGMIGANVQRLGTTASSGTVTFNITEDPEIIITHAPPVITITTGATQSVQAGTAITNTVVDSSTGGSVTGYTISPSLPANVTLNATTGVISGIPTGTQSLTPYTLTATGSGGTSSATFRLTVTEAPPILTITTGATQTVRVSSAITSTVSANSGGAITSYSIAPSLPTGVSLNTSTGVISGTPTGAQATNSYTLTALGPAGGTSNATFTLTVVAAPAITITVGATQSVQQGCAITSTAVTNTGGAISSYSTTTLPANLSLNTSTGVISGTPTNTQGSTTYTLTATGPLGQTSTAIFTLTVTATPPNISINNATQSVQVNTSITNTSISNSGGSVSSYSTASLPAGLTLNTSTGVISGTPTSTQSAATYTIRATGPNGATSDADFTLTVTAAPPVISITTGATQSVQLGSAITTTVVANTGGPITGFTVSPSLPAALTMNLDTGVISGIPASAQDSTTYTVTATGPDGGTSSASFVLSVVDASANIVTFDANDLSEGVTTQSSLVRANLTGNTFVRAGYTFVRWTTVADGTGDVYTNGASYSFAADLTLFAQWSATPPAISFTAGATQVIAVGAAITPTATTNTGGSIASWSVSTLPSGLTWDAATGVISGTPDAAQAVTTYTLTATGPSGATSAITFTLTVIAPPSIAIVNATQSVQVNTAITSTSITNSGGAVASYAAVGLPSGVSINSSTGVISGTPAGTQTSTRYTVTATGTAGATSTALFTLTVTAAPPNISITTGATQSVIAASDILTTVVTNSGGAITGFTISPGLPAGLTLDELTGAISGAPAGEQVLTTYTLTATGPNGGVSNATFTLTVLSAAAKTVTFNANDMSGRVATQSSMTTANLTDSPFARTGYVFVNWTTGDDGSGDPFANAASYNFAADFSLYAQWAVAAPSITFTAGATQSVQVNVAITPTATANTGGAITSWSVTTLPTGLSMAAGTGVISGTPTGVQTITTYTLTANGAAGSSSSVTFTLTVTAAPVIEVPVYVPPALYTITYVAGSHGTLSGLLSQTISSGASGSAVTATAETGYEFTSWSDGSTTNPRIDSSVFFSKSVTATFTYVGPRAQTITFVDPGNQSWSAFNLQLSPTASSTLAVVLTSTTVQVCTVSGFAITLITTGTCTLTATQIGGTVGSNIFAAATPVTRTFTIGKASGRTIAILATSYSASGYASWSLTGPTLTSLASAGDSDTKTYAVTADSDGCSVSFTGIVTFTGAGVCRVQVSISGTLFGDATSPAVSFEVGKKSQDMVFAANALTYNESLQLKAPANAGTGALTYSVPTNSGCSLVGDKVTANSGTGTCEITVTKAADKNYLATTTTMTITLSKASQTLTMTSAQLAYGQRVRVSAVSPLGVSGITYSLAETPSCSIKGNLVVALSGTGTCTVTAAKAGTTNYLPATSNAVITLTKAAQTLRFTAPRAMKTTQVAQKLSARATSGLTVSFQSSTPKICVVSAATVKAISTGTCSLAATQSGDANYAAAEGVSASFSVTGATKSAVSAAPVITWSAPAYMTLGDPLTNVQLNAQANVAGSFVYTPAVGTKLPKGTNKVTVVFTPTENPKSGTIQKSISITVVAPITPSASPITTEGVTPGTSRISGVPSTATVEVLGYSTVLDSAVISGPTLTVVASAAFSGTTTVNLLIRYFTQSIVLTVPVTVSPARAKSPIATPQSLTETIFSWGTTESATGYEVKVRGATVCSTTTASCTAQVPVGPATPITITTLGLEKSSVTTPVALHIDGPVSGLVVNFDTNSSVLSADALKQIRAIALIIAREGYTHLIVHGHTDIRGGVDNNALSNNRAQATLDYIQSLMPGVSFELEGYAATQPVASSESEAGLAANRRAEISVLP